MEGNIDEESLLTEAERNNATSQSMSSSLRRKAAKRTSPWLPAAEASLPSPSQSPSRSRSRSRSRSPLPAHDEDIPAAKMPRLMAPFPAAVVKAVTKTASTDAEETIPHVDADADVDSMTAMQPNVRANRAPPSVSTLESATDLASAENYIIQMKHNSYKEYRKQWSAAAAVAPVPIRTNMQLNRLSGWHPSHPSIFPTTGSRGMSTADQVNALRTLNDMNGYASILGLGQRISPCWNGSIPRGGAMHPTIAQTTRLMDMRIPDQRNVPEAQHNDNNWRMLDPGQTTTSLCPNRSNEAVDTPVDRQLNRLSGWHPSHPSIFPMTGSRGMSTADQVNALHTLNAMNGYASTAALLRSPCWNGSIPRGGAMHPSIAQTTRLMDMQDQCNVLETQYNDNNWRMLDPGQTTTSPCPNRLKEAVDTPVDRTTGPTGQWASEEDGIGIDQTTKQKGKWTKEEDGKLLRAAEKFAVTRWKAIAALIPGRTKKQCWNRWQYALDPSIVRMTERTGKWSPEEDGKLVGAVEKHNGKNWDAIAALVPSRTKRQCMDRWHKALDTSTC